MKNRQRMTKKGSKRHFTKNALRVHKKNLRTMPMRGGFRI